jgi:hypothetical protein
MTAKTYKLLYTYSFLFLVLNLGILTTNNVQAEEFFTIQNDELQRPTGY